MAENREFYLVIKGEKVIVSEEVYRAYKSSDRAERKRKQRMWRCRIKREKDKNLGYYKNLFLSHEFLH